MEKHFCVTGACIPSKNYMVDLSGRIEQIIRQYIEPGKYFTINRARQYGKTTTLFMLEQALQEHYIVLSLSFEAADEYFQSLSSLAHGLIWDIEDCLRDQHVPQNIVNDFCRPLPDMFPLRELGRRISFLCAACDSKIVLMIDEVDKSSDNQIFLSFLGMLREKYLKMQQGKDESFHSVILAGVYDIKNLKQKLHPGEETKYNSPWNIAADFLIDMNFTEEDIRTMLSDYESDHQTGMDIPEISAMLYEYTSGYPYLVSRLCQLTDERLADTDEFPDRTHVWSREGILSAIRLLLKEPNPLFEDISRKLQDHSNLKAFMQNLLFDGNSIPFKREVPVIDPGVTFGFLKEQNGFATISNRIFEMHLYDLFLAEQAINSSIYHAGTNDRNQYVLSDLLQMDLIMKKFYEHFEEIYSENDQKFVEAQGRKLFLLYLKPIINGTGNYYIESRTRNNRRTDIIVDYRGQRFIIELKIWHGNEYNERGKKQLFEYLDYYRQDKGYLLSFNFNKSKKTGVQELAFQGKRILEVVV